MIIVEKKQLDTLANKIQGLNMKDTRIAHAMGNLLARSSRERIRSTKKSPQNKAWADRTATTYAILQKAKARGDIIDIGSLLHVRGLLAKIGYSVSRFQFNGELSVFSKAEYSGFIQDGTKKMVARPFLGVSSDDYKKLRAMLIKHAVKQIEEKIW